MDAEAKHTSVPSIKQGELTIIDANAGSGKTTTLIGAMSVAALEWGLRPEHMLAMTFSTDMADELKSLLSIGRGGQAGLKQ